MARFFLTGDRAGQTIVLGGFGFVAGAMDVPDHEAEAARRIVCRYYGAIETEPIEAVAPITETAEVDNGAGRNRKRGKLK